MRLRAVGSLLLAILSPPALSAQAREVSVAGPSVLREATPRGSADAPGVGPTRFANLDVANAVQENHRTEGAIIGGAILGLPVLILGLTLGDDPDAGGDVNVPVATLTAAALGALIGAFIGGAIPKEPEPESQTALVTGS